MPKWAILGDPHCVQFENGMKNTVMLNEYGTPSKQAQCKWGHAERVKPVLKISAILMS